MVILYMKHPRLCNTWMCIDVTMHIHLTLGDVYKALKTTYTRRRNYLPNNKQTSSKHAPDPRIARELHKQPFYILPVTDPHYNIQPESRSFTECGRKNSPIWEANKFKTKDDTANVFLFLESTQNAVLYQCVLNTTSLKWRPWILIHWYSLCR